MPIRPSITPIGGKSCPRCHFPGENLTTEGLSEDSLFVGDRLGIGAAVLRVTQPRVPCYKIALRFGRDDMIKRFLLSGRSGFYFSVLEPGDVSADQGIEVLHRDPGRVSVAQISRLYLGQVSESELCARAMNLSALPRNWKAELLLRAQMNHETLNSQE